MIAKRYLDQTKLLGRSRDLISCLGEGQNLQSVELPTGCAVCSQFSAFWVAIHVEVGFGDTVVQVILASLGNPNKTHLFNKLDYGGILHSGSCCFTN